MNTAIEPRRPKSGWGVMRISPWHLAGVFETSGEAETSMAELGVGYMIRYGEGVAGSDKFVSAEPRAI